MPTALTDLGSIKTVLGIRSADTSQDDLLSRLITQASQAVTTYCQVDDFGLRAVTEIKSPSNQAALVVNQLPLQGLTYAGNVTQGSAVLTGLSQTTGLFPYQSVLAPSYFAAGTTIASVDSSSQVTLSTAATASGTGVSIPFGIAVYEDQTALGGSAPTAFTPATSLLQEGQDYWVAYASGPGSICKSGLIYRTRGIWWRPAAYVSGLLTGQFGPATNSLKVIYPCGYATIPFDLSHACELLISKARRSRLSGESVQSFSYEGASTTLTARQWLGLFSEEITELLSPYKVIPM